MICGKEFKPKGYQRTCSQECREKYHEQYQKQYRKQWNAKNCGYRQRVNFVYSSLHSGEGIRYKEECCGDDYSKAKVDLYRLIIFFPLTVRPVMQFFYLAYQYNEKCKLLMKKEEQKEKQRKEKYRLLKIKRDALKQYCKDNKLNYNKEWWRRYISERYKTDLKHQLSHKMKVAIYISLKRGNKKGRHWEDLVGYTLNKLERRLQKTMPEGYTWQDFMEGKLHIDHIIPISAFNFTESRHPDFKRCWVLDNLRLLPSKENHIKWGKLEKPFQPALKLGLKLGF